MFSRGFTKIDIIISVSLIIIVIGIDFGVISYLNKKEQDIQILSEISQIRSGLETFILINNYYPEAPEPISLNDVYQGTEKLCQEGFKRASDTCLKTIMPKVPNVYKDIGINYSYKTIDANNYQIEFYLLTNFKNLGLLKGPNCATNNQIMSQTCF